MMNILEKLAQVTTFVFDVDGVLTDGTLIVLPNGIMARTMNTKDGYALQLAIKKGYEIIIISGGNSEEVTHRLQLLGIKHIFMKEENKLHCLQTFLQSKNIDASQVVFMGDDIPDYAAMKYVGIAACPNDAVDDIKNISSYISPLKGGQGCVRELIEKVMKLRGDWTFQTDTTSI